jgi:HemY protein
MARGAAAAAEQDWSDIDPDGVAFAYSPADWARLVSTYAETGDLIHPRFERRELVISDLPRMPVAYEPESFVTAAELGLTPIPLDDPRAWSASGFDGASFDDGPDPDSAPPSSNPRRVPPPRRRIGSPRAK